MNQNKLNLIFESIKSKKNLVMNKVHVSFKARLLTLSILPLFIVSLISLFLVQNSNQLISNLKFIIEDTVSAVSNSKDMITDTRVLKSSLEVLVFENVSEDFFDEQYVQAENAIQKINLSAKLFSEINMPEKVEVIKNKVDKTWKNLVPRVKEILSMIDSEPDNKEKLKNYFNESLKNDLSTLLLDLANIQLANTEIVELERNKLQAQKTYSKFITTLVAIGLNLAVFMIIFIFISKLTNNLKKSAQLIDQAMDTFYKNSLEIEQIGNQINNVFQKIGQSIEETSSSAHEVKLMTQKNRDSIKESSEILNNNNQGVEDALDVSKKMESKFSTIKQYSEELVRVFDENLQEMSKIDQLINDVNQKITTINDVVFQTKLLSFNASVEAARAGEAGKGFSVVAGEISNLAKQSGDSAQEIFKLMEDTKSQISSIIKSSTLKSKESLGKTSSQIDESLHLVKDMDSIFGKLKEGFEKSSQISSSVASSSDEQSTGVSNLEASFHSINGLSSESIKSIKTMSQRLTNIIDLSKEAKNTISDLEKLIS